MMDRRRICIFVVLIFISTFMAPGLYAEDRVASGAKDIAKGFASLPREMAQTANESNALNGLIVGGASGLVSTVKYIGEGLFKIFTFYTKEEHRPVY